MHCDLLFEHRVDRHDDVGVEGVGLLEIVLGVEEDRVFSQRRHIGAKAGDDDHERRVLDQDSGVSMVRVIVVGAMCDHHVGVPLADFAGDRPAVFERRQQFPIVDIEYLGLDAQDLGAFLDLGRAAPGQDGAGDFDDARCRRWSR